MTDTQDVPAEPLPATGVGSAGGDVSVRTRRRRSGPCRWGCGSRSTLLPWVRACEVTGLAVALPPISATPPPLSTIGYLINQYPKVSHTFIRREIAALEALGHIVERFTLRATKERLPDEDDRAEIARTRAVLSVGVLGLMGALLKCAVTRPIRLWRALVLTLKIGWRSERGLVINLIYLAEACVLLGWVENRIRHLHAHFGNNPATVAMLCHALGGPPFSFTPHGPEEFDRPELIAMTEKIERAAFVAAVSSFGRSQLYRWCGYRYWPKIQIIHCGLGQAILDSEVAPIAADRRLVCVARLGEQKGQLVLIEAAAKLAASGTPFELVLVGEGELRPEIQRQIAHHGLGDRVRITGWMDHHGVKKEIEAGRVFILPSFAEGLPVAIMEAFAYGRPVLSTYIAGIPELVLPGENGWLVPAGSVDKLAEAMRQALETPIEEIMRMGRQGKLRVKERHDIRASAQRLSDLFERS